MSILIRTFQNVFHSISEIVFSQNKSATEYKVESEQTHVSIDREYNDMLQLKPSYNLRPRKDINYKPLTL